jgi:hypothetical protein
MTCKFLYCNHQVHKDFLITLYYHTNTLQILCIASVQPTHDARQNYSATYHGRTRCILSDTNQEIQPNACDLGHERRSTGFKGATQANAYTREFLSIQRNKAHLYLKETARPAEGYGTGHIGCGAAREY